MSSVTHYTLEDLVAQCDPSAAASDDEAAWLDAPTVGEEIVEYGSTVVLPDRVRALLSPRPYPGVTMSKVEERLAQLGIVLPEPVAPVANYVPFVRSGDMVHISGQVSIDASGGIKGIVGEAVDLETAQRAARLCGLNLLAQMKAAAGGDLDRVARVVKLGGFVQVAPDFFDIPKVVNGCSDLMVEVFGDAGRHARSAVGVYRLPLDFAVEVDAVVELK